VGSIRPQFTKKNLNKIKSFLLHELASSPQNGAAKTHIYFSFFNWGKGGGAKG